jgi:hypothetical protein
MFFCSIFLNCIPWTNFSKIVEWIFQLRFENNSHTFNSTTERLPGCQKDVKFRELMFKCWVPLVISSVLQISTNTDTVDTPLNLSLLPKKTVWCSALCIRRLVERRLWVQYMPEGTEREIIDCLASNWNWSWSVLTFVDALRIWRQCGLIMRHSTLCLACSKLR